MDMRDIQRDTTVAVPEPKRPFFSLSPLNQRRWRNFKKNRRAFWSLWIFGILFGLSMCAELIAYDKPILVRYQSQFYMPIWNFYAETDFGGDFQTEAAYRDPEVQCLIVSGGLESCFDDPDGVIEDAQDGVVDGAAINKGWTIWPLIPYSFDTAVDRPGAAPLPPNGENLLGTDGTKRDVLARVIHGFRLSVLFTLLVTGASAVIGVIAGAVQGYFGGRTDLIFQRIIEIWSSTPSLYVIIIMFAILGRSFWLLVFLLVLFGWTGLVGVVRAEFLRARNLEYVRAARALGVSNLTIMFRHMLHNAMVATLTFLPFIMNGSVTTLTSLDFLGFGLPPGSASLGELLAQGKNNVNDTWLGITVIIVMSIYMQCRYLDKHQKGKN